jgi:NTE family protein
MAGGGLVCVLSGGGAKAAAHIGAHRALEEFGLIPSRYVATSMGAVVAACFASGLDYDGVLRRMLGIHRRNVAVPSLTLLAGPFASSLLAPRRLRKTIVDLVPVQRFAELRRPLTVTAVDAETGQLEVFGDGGKDAPLIDALWASCALPVYYPPVEVSGRRYVDGGLRAVLPLDVAARFEPDLVVAVRVGPSFSARRAKQAAYVPPLLEAHNRVLRTCMAAQADDVLARWQAGRIPFVLVEPPIEEGATFAVESVVAHVEGGYRAAVQALGASRGLLPFGVSTESRDGS